MNAVGYALGDGGVRRSVSTFGAGSVSEVLWLGGVCGSSIDSSVGGERCFADVGGGAFSA
jgi:hypothetical protein